MTALPFDLREFASSDDGDSDFTTPGRSLRGAGSRPSHTITIAPSLVERVQARDVDAFRELVRETYAPLVRFGRSILQSRDDAEDVVQDVFVMIWDLGPRWAPARNPVAYLFASVRNRALKEVRRRTRASIREQRAQDTELISVGAAAADRTVGPLSDIVDTETNDYRIRQVTAILATLPERQRTVYELRYRRGLTVPAIADVLGMTLKSAEHITARVTRTVLDRLREIVEQTA